MKLKNKDTTTLNMTDGDRIAMLKESLENMVGVFDTPIARRKINSPFAQEARDDARNTLKLCK